MISLGVAGILLAASSATALDAATPPTATVRNGTYYGYHAPAYGTDNFLGIPYAQPPVGDLRFRVPQPLNSSWSDLRNATEYGYQCIGYGKDTWSQGNYVDEDCLTLNVIRSRGAGDALPVLVWIHGGGLVMGGSSDRRYNQSFIVQQSAQAGMPIVAVSINYRLSAWGFLYGKEIQDSGNAMAGFRDQRLALQWIRENIAAFGGDPDRVTIQGESAGGTSVAAQLLAYNGRDDKLFAGAIAESGNPAGVAAYPTADDWEPVIANISSQTGCGNARQSVLDCLRTVPVERLNAVLNSTATRGARYGFVVDGDFIQDYASAQLERGDFVRVPYIIGTNTDEGTGFGGANVNTSSEFLEYVQDLGYDNATAQDLTILYPDIPEIGIPATIEGRPNSTIGLQFKRTAALGGDLRMTAPRRFAAQWWAKHSVPVYSYRFNVLVSGGIFQVSLQRSADSVQVNGISWLSGAVHFQEVAFVFYNTEGLGYPQNGGPNPMGGEERPKYLKLAQLMTRMWISFANFGDPNRQLGVDAEAWPAYSVEDSKNFVFEQNTTSHAEPDYYRAEGMEYISGIILANRG
ncbi:Lipase 4 [Fulvia fulva]|nr:Lipase 4 [Fulvia fulva]WPV13663.1 Lipase 4 [Fulvia fulva]WPV28803.1 Lipase 4 [Fulvia fulva]